MKGDLVKFKSYSDLFTNRASICKNKHYEVADLCFHLSTTFFPEIKKKNQMEGETGYSHSLSQLYSWVNRLFWFFSQIKSAGTVKELGQLKPSNVLWIDWKYFIHK